MISDFRGEYAFLSNFADSPLYYKGLKFANAEAAFQAQKATDLQTKESFCSMRAIVAKKTGKKDRTDFRLGKSKAFCYV